MHFVFILALFANYPTSLQGIFACLSFLKSSLATVLSCPLELLLAASNHLSFLFTHAESLHSAQKLIAVLCILFSSPYIFVPGRDFRTLSVSLLPFQDAYSSTLVQ